MEINSSYQFSRPKIPHTVFEVVKQKKKIIKKEIMKQQESWKQNTTKLVASEERRAVKTGGVVLAFALLHCSLIHCR